MFFILSKILAYLIMPLTVICCLFILSALVKRQALKNKLFYIGLSLLLLLSNDFMANEVALRWEVPITPFRELSKNYAWGILLTGVTKTEEGFHDRVFFNRGADRVTHAVQLYKIGRIKRILVSGGSGRLFATDRKEADDVAEALILMGVPDSSIVKESNSRNTHESAEAVRKILEGTTKPSECLLITSAYHMRRSSACFAKVGWRMDCFSTDFISHRRKYSIGGLLLPSTEALDNWQLMIKEWVGIVFYKVAGYV